MNKLLTLITIAASLSSYGQDSLLQKMDSDTTVAREVIQAEDIVIDEVVSSPKAPQPETVHYLSQTTRYGMKNLFNKYAYTTGFSYTNQINSNAGAFMDNYIRRHGKTLMDMKGWGQPYFALIENIFSQYGLPHELKYLAVIESHLKVGATSWVGAGGPWQFMPYTAREFGLKVQPGYDERRDYVKSTHAAAKYLLQLYRQMDHDWLLVIAAYNCGPGGVYKAKRRSGSSSFWDMQYFLPQESRDHVKKFIATHYIMEGGAGGGFFAGVNAATGEGIDGYTQAVAYRSVNGGSIAEFERAKPTLNATDSIDIAVTSVSGKYKSKVIAKFLELEIKEFSRLNPYFDQLLNEGNNYDMRLPMGKMQQFKAYKYDILNECVQDILNSEVNYINRTSYPKKKLRVKGK